MKIELPPKHYVRDYRSMVAQLVATHPLDEAMSMAVGGQFEKFGKLETELLIDERLQDGHTIIDIGCGSGRLASYLGPRFPNLDYVGTDVVQELLDYAAKLAPKYRFLLHTETSIPAADESVDFVTAFSVFTHLFHEESYTYLRDAKRVLKPGGAVIFSFLEASKHWLVFEEMLDPHFQAHKTHLNMFIERSAITEWGAHLGLTVNRYDDRLGQTTVVLRN